MERGLQALETLKTKYLERTSALQEITEENLGLKQTLAFEQEQYGKLLNQKKSSEVRTGKIAEQMAPFLMDYPLSPATAKFIGDPIDFVHFDDDKITFVEVKSGKSQLSTRQRHIRELIEGGKVGFTLYRILGDGPDKS
jgi:predicted Holliday junction resolvase-like endonuclease